MATGKPSYDRVTWSELPIPIRVEILRQSRYSWSDVPSHIRKRILHEAHLQQLVDENMPPFTKCPLTGQVFRDPVYIADSCTTGDAYERDALQKYWAQHGLKEPSNGQDVSGDVVANINVRMMVAYHRDSLRHCFIKWTKWTTNVPLGYQAPHSSPGA